MWVRVVEQMQGCRASGGEIVFWVFRFSVEWAAAFVVCTSRFSMLCFLARRSVARQVQVAALPVVPRRLFSAETKPLSKDQVMLFDEALTLVTRLSRAHFDETVEVRRGVNRRGVGFVGVVQCCVCI